VMKKKRVAGARRTRREGKREEGRGGRGRSMANRSQPPLVSWKLSCNRAR